MKACVATGEIRRVVCQEVPTPQAGPGMLLLKTRYACICGSMYLIAHKQIDPKPLISEIIPFADIQRAVDSVYSGRNITVLLKP